ncbi:hypothetical protein Hanom_Chr11g01025741 [Helianthus anomalus]
MHDKLSVRGDTDFNSPVAGVNEEAGNEEVEDGEIIKSPREKAERVLNLAADHGEKEILYTSTSVGGANGGLPTTSFLKTFLKTGKIRKKPFNLLEESHVHAQEEDFGNQVQPTIIHNEEREEVGTVLSNGLEADFVGPGSVEFRPSYVTCRPKRGKKPKKKAHPVVIPDLNQEAEISNNSDPFNIEEIFRMEEGIRDILT